jgi:hypothetical protein
MNDFQTRISVLLHDAVPEPPRQLDPADVVATSAGGRRSRFLAPVAVAAIVIAIATVVATFHPSGHDKLAPPLALQPTPVVAVTGRLLAVGGPAPGTAHPIGGTVTVTNLDTQLQRTVVANNDGRFSTAVPPGPYHLEAHSPSYLDGKVACQADGPLTVVANRPARADVYCQMK